MDPASTIVFIDIPHDYNSLSRLLPGHIKRAIVNSLFVHSLFQCTMKKLVFKYCIIVTCYLLRNIYSQNNLILVTSSCDLKIKISKIRTGKHISVRI